ncbi:hypothetical protein FQA47_014892 [Oryzias melastigma]|uniref:Uncharacterized protein n=1 Tax=Oryzias melastigma TaxID=30732 RepID=A0A834C6I1_ORYME|nr:hypothetical protein FQA47_014892 [Oryzias melastigma]
MVKHFPGGAGSSRSGGQQADSVSELRPPQNHSCVAEAFISFWIGDLRNHQCKDFIQSFKSCMCLSDINKYNHGTEIFCCSDMDSHVASCQILIVSLINMD